MLTRTVLNPRSREVWRQTGRERAFRVLTGSPQCGGFRAKPVVIGDFSAANLGGESWSKKDWRRERNWDPTVSEVGVPDLPHARGNWSPTRQLKTLENFRRCFASANSACRFIRSPHRRERAGGSQAARLAHPSSAGRRPKANPQSSGILLQGLTGGALEARQAEQVLPQSL